MDDLIDLHKYYHIIDLIFLVDCCDWILDFWNLRGNEGDRGQIRGHEERSREYRKLLLSSCLLVPFVR